jgi:hypothetical protein
MKKRIVKKVNKKAYLYAPRILRSAYLALCRHNLCQKTWFERGCPNGFWMGEEICYWAWKRQEESNILYHLFHSDSLLPDEIKP